MVTAHDKLTTRGGISPAEPVVDVRSLTAAYGDVRALGGVDLTIWPGEVVALLGPNGAGKTTLIETIVGLRPIQQGKISILGVPVVERAVIAGRIGVQPQRGGLYQHLTVRETFRLWASLFELRIDTDEHIARIGLTEKADARFAKLSGGQQQRVMLGLALINDPALLVLDEPTGSLDPHGRRDIWRVVSEHRRHGGTVLMATHSMEEAQSLSTRVGIIDAGMIVAQGAADELIQRVRPYERVTMRCQSPDVGRLGALAGLVEMRTTELVGWTEVELVVRSAEAVIPSILAITSPSDLAVHRSTLEDVFVALTGRGLEH